MKILCLALALFSFGMIGYVAMFNWALSQGRVDCQNVFSVSIPAEWSERYASGNIVGDGE